MGSVTAWLARRRPSGLRQRQRAGSMALRWPANLAGSWSQRTHGLVLAADGNPACSRRDRPRRSPAGTWPRRSRGPWLFDRPTTSPVCSVLPVTRSGRRVKRQRSHAVRVSFEIGRHLARGHVPQEQSLAVPEAGGGQGFCRPAQHAVAVMSWHSLQVGDERSLGACRRAQ